MHSVEETVEVAVPVRTAYNQWTQFKTFPRFMTTVRRVDQIKPALTSWTLALGPVRGVFDAEILEQEPDSHLVWRSFGQRPAHSGQVVFESLAADRTKVTVRMEIASRGATGLLATVPRLAGRVLRRELRGFKAYIEGLGEESGAWRGTIRNGRLQRTHEERLTSGVPCWPVG